MFLLLPNIFLAKVHTFGFGCTGYIKWKLSWFRLKLSIVWKILSNGFPKFSRRWAVSKMGVLSLYRSWNSLNSNAFWCAHNKLSIHVFPVLNIFRALLRLMNLPYRPFDKVPWPNYINKLIRFSTEAMLLCICKKEENDF